MVSVDPMAVRTGTKLERRKLLVLYIENQRDCGEFSLHGGTETGREKASMQRGGLGGKITK